MGNNYEVNPKKERRKEMEPIKELNAFGTSKDEVAGQVYFTRNYEQFKTLLGNRSVEEERIEKIEKSMMIKQIPIPIIVNEHMEVIDGQGRLEVCKRNNLPIWYCVCPGLTINDCFIANIYSTNWSEKDVLKRYATTGNENYKRVIKVMERFRINAAMVMLAAGRSIYEPSKREKMKWGDLLFTESDEYTATMRLEMAEEVMAAIGGAKRIKQSNIFRNAILRCSKEDGYQHDRMVASCNSNATRYRDCSTVAEMLEQLAVFYNKGRRGEFMDVYGTGAALKVRFDEKINRYKK